MPNVSQEATGDPAKNMQDERCGAISNRWSGSAVREFLARLRTPAAQLEAVRTAAVMKLWLVERKGG
jgi:hypothetical protein